MGVDILKGEHGAFLYCNTTDLPLMTELFSEPEEAEKFLDWWNREQGGYGEESDLRNLTPRELAEVRSDWDRRRRDNEQS